MSGPREPSQEELRHEARAVRHDNDDGGPGYFDPEEARWTLERIPLHAFMHVMREHEWDAWLDREIATADCERPTMYAAMLHDEILEPIVATMIDGRARIWDGYHRVAASVAKHAADVPAIVGRRGRQAETG